MRRVVLTFGLIAGVILSGMLVATLALARALGFDWLEHGMVIGYTTMVLSFLLVYFGIRSYRDNVAGGEVSFGRAFAVGLLISVVASLCYVVTWQIAHTWMVPDFSQKYVEHAMEKARASGATPEQLAAKAREMAEFQELYKNPLVVAAYTFLEPLPVGLLMALVGAGLLRRRRGAPETRSAVGQASHAV